MEYVADFETTTDINDCRVWAWCVCEIGNADNLTYGIDIDSFMSFCETNGGVYWFHNLSFDGEFVLHYLFSNGYTLSNKSETKTFKTLISGTGKWYQLTVTFDRHKKQKGKTAIYRDSLKKLPFSVNKIAESFKLPISKLTIDYAADRPIGHRLTQQERDYIKNDVQIIALALEQQFNAGLDKLTIGSDALNHFKSEFRGWRRRFPEIHLLMDAEIRRAYKGGYTYANPVYQNKIINAGCVFDVNSLYPDVMYHKPMPYGVPVFFHGQYEDDEAYPLYIQNITCHCKLKSEHLPTLQIKNNMHFNATQYLSETDGYVDLSLTNVDLAILHEHYNLDIMSFNGGYKFKSMIGMFNTYIDYWMEQKHIAEDNDNEGLRTLAKLMLNSLYGKTATNPNVTGKFPYYDNGIVRYEMGEPEWRKPVYTAAGAFITAWARDKTIRAAQGNYKRFLYCDTDSIHLLGLEHPTNIEIDRTELGAWKHEYDFTQAKFIRAKTYVEIVNEKTVVKCAGLPDGVKNQITLDNFNKGLQLEGKLRPIHTQGGIVLTNTTFTLL